LSNIQLCDHHSMVRKRLVLNSPVINLRVAENDIFTVFVLFGNLGNLLLEGSPFFVSCVDFQFLKLLLQFIQVPTRARVVCPENFSLNIVSYRVVFLYVVITLILFIKLIFAFLVLQILELFVYVTSYYEDIIRSYCF